MSETVTRVNAALDGRYRIRSRSIWLCLMSMAACGTDPVQPSTETLLEEPREALTGLVIATDTLDIIPVPVATITDPNFLIPRQFTGVLPVDLPATTGMLLVLSLREVIAARPCPTSVFNNECATMVVLEEDGPLLGRRPGRLTVSSPDPVTYYPWGNFRLVPEAEST